TETSPIHLESAWMPDGGPSNFRARPVKLEPRTRLSPLESMLPDVSRLVLGHLQDADRARLKQTSHTMYQVTQGDIKARAAEVAAGVVELLKIPHPDRTVKHLVDIRLLPESALQYPFSEAKIAVLTADNIIKGLLLNIEKGVGVDLRAFSHIPSDRMPRVRNGIAMLDDEESSRRIPSHENNRHITLGDDTKVTIFSEIVKSRMFANALCDHEFSLFEKCLEHFKYECRDHTRPLNDSDLVLMKQWASVVHQTVHCVQRHALPPNTFEGRMGYVGFSSRFEAVLTHRDIVEILLTQGIDFDIAKADGKTPLICAAMHEHSHMEQTMAVLLEHGVNVDHADRWGFTALHWAAKTGAVSRVELLLRHGANVDHVDGWGRNVLHNLFATCTWDGEETSDIARALVQCLLDSRINLFQRDHMGQRPIDYISQSVMREEVPRDIATMVENAMRAQRQARRDERGGCVVA
ncbi:MAG TPA: ankyrin repeat domain-containing protein, partial [Burkholderiaceae bacterium]|nr:ankyrin repeat domain-containing protein [Burkholderiaceae bacterium]